MPFVIAANGNFTMPLAATLMSVEVGGDAGNGALILTSGTDLNEPTSSGRLDVLVYKSGAGTGTLSSAVDFSSIGGIPLAKKQQLQLVNGGSILAVFK